MATVLTLVNGQITEVEAAAGSASVPTLATAPYTVPANSQVLFTEMIDLDGQELILDGVLVEVN
jgi:hypothetical protein